jgi:hypothetical protein
VGFGTGICHEGPALPQGIGQALPLPRSRCDEGSVLCALRIAICKLGLTSTMIRTMHDKMMIAKVRLKRISGFAKGLDEKQKSILFGKITILKGMMIWSRESYLYLINSPIETELCRLPLDRSSSSASFIRRKAIYSEYAN